MSKEMLMYQLREKMCLIYSAHQVREYYFQQMTLTSIRRWWKSWTSHHVKLGKIRENMPESATTLTKTKASKLGLKTQAIHEAANLRLYKLSGQVVEWYKADQALSLNHELEMNNHFDSPTNRHYRQMNETYTSWHELGDILKSGLDGIVGEPDDNCTKGDKNEH